MESKATFNDGIEFEQLCLSPSVIEKSHACTPNPDHHHLRKL